MSQLPALTITPASDPSVDQQPTHDDDDKSTISSPKSSRHSSPSRLSTELIIKCRSQMSRIKTLRGFHNTLMLDENIDTPAARTILQSAEEVHEAFSKEHAYFERAWPIEHLDHAYFEDDVLSLKGQLICDIRQLASKHSEAVASHATPSPPTARDTTAQFSKLPRLTLKTFDGDYQEWPSFCDLFKSMVIGNSALNDLERLYYLKLSVDKIASEVISHVPLTENAFASAWRALEERFGNQRVLVDAQLCKLVHEHSTSDRQREASGFLQQLISGVDSALNTLQLIGQSTENWDCLIVFNTVRQFSPRTRELWEASVSKMTSYPTYLQLKEFITQRSRTLEQTEAARTSTSGTQGRSSTSSQQSHQRSSNHASASQSDTRTLGQRFQCDCCLSKHFVASCPEFLELSDEDKKEVVTKRRLCHNCLGRHNTPDCKSQIACRTCNRWHHTLLHGAITRKDLPASNIKLSRENFNQPRRHLSHVNNRSSPQSPTTPLQLIKHSSPPDNRPTEPFY